MVRQEPAVQSESQAAARPPVRIFAFVYPPYVLPKRNGTDGGIDVEFFSKITTALGFRMEVSYVQNFTGYMVNHLGEMAAGRYDIAISSIGLSPSVPSIVSMHHFKLSPLVSVEQLLMVSRRSRESRETSSGTLGVLSRAVWAWLLLSFLLFRHLDKAAHRCRRAMRPESPRSPSPLTMTGWWFAAGVVFNIYANSLAISLDRPPRPTPMFSTAREMHRLLKSRKCRFITDRTHPDDFGTIKDIMRDFSGVTRAETELYEPAYVAKNRIELSRLVATSPLCYISACWASAREGQARMDRGQDFVALKEFPRVPTAYVYRPGGEFADALATLFASGDLAAVYQTHADDWLARHVREGGGPAEEASEDAPLRLGQLADVFAGTVGLGAVAAAALAAELLAAPAIRAAKARRKLWTLPNGMDQSWS